MSILLGTAVPAYKHEFSILPQSLPLSIINPALETKD